MQKEKDCFFGSTFIFLIFNSFVASESISQSWTRPRHVFVALLLRALSSLLAFVLVSPQRHWRSSDRPTFPLSVRGFSVSASSSRHERSFARRGEQRHAEERSFLSPLRRPHLWLSLPEGSRSGRSGEPRVPLTPTVLPVFAGFIPELVLALLFF